MREERPDTGTGDAVEPDVVPEGAPRGGITVPDANDTGITTPPIAGWGSDVAEEKDKEARPPDE